jgi:uncharacterized protein YbjT (DUF2867 family)
MVGQGVLRECLLDADVKKVLSVGRSQSGQHDPKLREVVLKDLSNLTPIERDLRGYDSCFFTLGVSSVGMKEPDYRRITYDLTIGAARILAALNPGMTFAYISGMNTDPNSKTMWARVKGETENAILAMPFKASYAFRPGFIQPLHGVKSKTALYRIPYAILGPFNALFRKWFPKYATTTEILGRAMIKAARYGAPKKILESQDINAL